MQHHQIYKTEDQLIAQLDRGARTTWRDREWQQLQLDAAWRQRCRLAMYRRLADAGTPAALGNDR